MPGYFRPVFPEFGPDDTAAEAAALRSDFKASFYVWHTDRWHCNYKAVIYWSEVADNTPEMRRKLDKKLAAAIPGLQAQLMEAEAAAERLRAVAEGNTQEHACHTEKDKLH